MSSCLILLFHVVCYTLMGFVTASKPLSILLMQTLPSISHHIWTENLVKGLLREGHHVHVVSTIEIKVEGKLVQNLTNAIFENTTLEDANYGPDQWEKLKEFYMAYVTYQFAISYCDTLIKTNAARQLLEMIKTIKFDVIVADISLHQCFYGLWEVAKDKPPVVGVLPLGNIPFLKNFIGVSSYPTVRPYTSATFAKPVGLWLRTWNTLYYIVDDLIRYYYFLPIVQRLAEEYVGHTIRPLYEIEKDKVNIVLVNSHPAFESAIPLPPNVLEIGGLHAQIVQPIAGDVIITYSEEVRVFLDEAKNGAIIISLGTNVNWKPFGQNKIKAVIMALSKLKQRVLWKLDIEKIEIPFKIPDNIMIMKWISQRKILSHKNVKAIWLHGGLLSTQEAIWVGVPTIITPFFLDQKSNAEILVAKGVGIRLDFKTLSMQSLLHAMEEVLYNKSYTRNMKRLSSEFRDRPLPPLDLAVWSIKYVVRHPNGSLATPLKFQTWIVQNLIDVYTFLLFNFFVILFSIFFVAKIFINFYYNCINCTSKLRKRKQM